MNKNLDITTDFYWFLNNKRSKRNLLYYWRVLLILNLKEIVNNAKGLPWEYGCRSIYSDDRITILFYYTSLNIWQKYTCRGEKIFHLTSILNVYLYKIRKLTKWRHNCFYIKQSCLYPYLKAKYFISIKDSKF